MRVVRATAERRKPSTDEIFVGSVDMQTVFDEGEDLRLIEVHFKGGARNRRHTHTTDQILIVTEGKGIVGAGSEEREVHPGDVAFIPAGEVHWHGAKAGNDMTHWAINGRTSRTSIKE